MLRILAVLIIVCFPSIVLANDYMTLRSNEVYMRYGPSTNHPIKWVYQKKGWPVEIKNTFDQWTKVRDINGEEGWIHKSLLSRRSYAIVQSNNEKSYVVLRKKKASGLVRIEDGGLVKVHECDDLVCKVSISSFKGYLEKKLLWGIVQNQ